MNTQQTATSYDHLASYWNSDKMDRTNGIAQHRRAFQFAKDKRNALDIGCGSSGRLIDLLISEGYEVEGLDISPEMIRLSQQGHPALKFHQADICTWEFTKKYDFISAWDSIWHAPLEEQESLLNKICKGLELGGILIFTSGGVDEPGEVTNPFLDQPLYHAALGIPKLLEVIAQQGCICRHLEYDQHPQMHLYLIVQKAI